MPGAAPISHARPRPDGSPAAAAPRPHFLVLGASGYIGSACAREIQAAGDTLSVLRHRRQLPPGLHPQRVYRGSLLTFRWSRLKARPPQQILHFARISARGRLGRHLASTLSEYANRRLLAWLEQQAAAQAAAAGPDVAPTGLTLIAGTLAYGDHGDESVDETQPLNPSGFARQYALGEAPFIAALRSSRCPVRIMRPAWVYGPHSWLRSFYLLPMLREGFVPLYGGGRNWISLIHVEDAARLIRYLSLHGPAGENYNLVCGPPLRQAELAEMLAAASSMPVRHIIREDLQTRDTAVWESLTFSQRTISRHTALYQQCGFRHPDHAASLAQIWQRFMSQP